MEMPTRTFSLLRSLIHEKFQYIENHSIGDLHPRRNEFYGATDALWDTIEMLKSAASLHAKGDDTERKLISYGILNALYVQQDSVRILADIISDEKISIKSRIRVLRNRLAGHPAYASQNGNTSSIPVTMDAGWLSFQIYGLKDNDPDRFFQRKITELIDENYSDLIPFMEKIITNFPSHEKLLKANKEAEQEDK